MKTTIKVLLPILFFFSFSTLVKADITVVKSGAGPHGYYSVAENHSGGSSQLFCSDPGNEGCKWMIQPSLIVPSTGDKFTSDQIAAMVEEQISQNVLQGSFYLENDQTILVSWSGTDVNDYRMDVVVNQN